MFGIQNLKIVKYIANNKTIWELICLLLSIMSAYYWITDSMAGYRVMILLISLFLLVFNDIKFIIPILIYGIFINNGSNIDVELMSQMIVMGGSCVAILFIYFLLNKPSIKLNKNTIPLFLIALFTLIPYFWRIEVPEVLESTSLLYFSGFAYLFIYLLFRKNKTDSVNIVLKTMTYLPLLLFIQVFYTQNTNYIENNELLYWFNLGWGIGNEVSIMICMSLPFVFYRLIKSKYRSLMIYVFVLGIITVVLTFSRGGYLFVGLELFLLFLYCLTKIKYKKLAYFITIIVGISLLYYFNSIDLLEKLFLFANPGSEDAFSDSSRFTLFEQAFDLFTASFRNFIFGSGMISEFIGDTKFVVYHSTIFQGLVMGGMCMFIALIYHCYKKYMPLVKSKNTFASIMIIGFLCVDLYGLIDNTYFMYYYMIPLVIILASFDNMSNETINLE